MVAVSACMCGTRGSGVLPSTGEILLSMVNSYHHISQIKSRLRDLVKEVADDIKQPRTYGRSLLDGGPCYEH